MRSEHGRKLVRLDKLVFKAYCYNIVHIRLGIKGLFKQQGKRLLSRLASGHKLFLYSP